MVLLARPFPLPLVPYLWLPALAHVTPVSVVLPTPPWSSTAYCFVPGVRCPCRPPLLSPHRGPVVLVFPPLCPLFPAACFSAVATLASSLFRSGLRAFFCPVRYALLLSHCVLFSLPLPSLYSPRPFFLPLTRPVLRPLLLLDLPLFSLLLPYVFSSFFLFWLLLSFPVRPFAPLLVHFPWLAPFAFPPTLLPSSRFALPSVAVPLCVFFLPPPLLRPVAVSHAPPLCYPPSVLLACRRGPRLVRLCLPSLRSLFWNCCLFSWVVPPTVFCLRLHT